MTAAQRWTDELAAWAIDPDILARAPESPYALPPELFAARHRPGSGPRSPMVALARTAVPPRGTVLDVGAGAGAAGLTVVPPGGHLHAVERQPSMLDRLTEAAAEQGVALTTYLGSWPEIAEQVPTCDVAVCAHVAYNVADLAGFARALSAHARRRVVLELHAQHPWVPLAPLWHHFHGQDRPTGPTADLALDVLREAGLAPRVTSWREPAHVIEADLWRLYVAFTRRRLCLTADRDDEVASLLRAQPQEPRESVVLDWDC